jgi:hypothetical protein
MSCRTKYQLSLLTEHYNYHTNNYNVYYMHDLHMLIYLVFKVSMLSSFYRWGKPDREVKWLALDHWRGETGFEPQQSGTKVFTFTINVLYYISIWQLAQTYAITVFKI